MRTSTAIARHAAAGAPRHRPVPADADPAAVLLELAAGLAADDPRAALASAAHAVAMLQARVAASNLSGGLTRAETRVAMLGAAGAANREIAERLHLSVRTVECHLSRIYAKLGVRSKAELAASWAFTT